jgi:hypothetical protein
MSVELSAKEAAFRSRRASNVCWLAGTGRNARLAGVSFKNPSSSDVEDGGTGWRSRAVAAAPIVIFTRQPR